MYFDLNGQMQISDREDYGCSKSGMWSRSRRLGYHLGLGAICLGLGLVGLVSGLGPLRLVETFCAGARRAYCSCS